MRRSRVPWTRSLGLPIPRLSTTFIVDSQGIDDSMQLKDVSACLFPCGVNALSLYAPVAGEWLMMHAPIRVITVEREYGSRGGEFAHDLAERLGWRLLDSELVRRRPSGGGFAGAGGQIRRAARSLVLPLRQGVLARLRPTR